MCVQSDDSTYFLCNQEAGTFITTKCRDAERVEQIVAWNN